MNECFDLSLLCKEVVDKSVILEINFRDDRNNYDTNSFYLSQVNLFI